MGPSRGAGRGVAPSPLRVYALLGGDVPDVRRREPARRRGAHGDGIDERDPIPLGIETPVAGLDRVGLPETAVSTARQPIRHRMTRNISFNVVV